MFPKGVDLRRLTEQCVSFSRTGGAVAKPVERAKEEAPEKKKGGSYKKSSILYYITCLKLLFHRFIKRRRKRNVLKRQIDLPFGKVIFEDIVVEVLDSDGKKVGDAEVFVMLHSLNNKISFDSDEAKKGGSLQVPLDDFTETFGHGFSSLNEEVLREIIKNRVPKVLKVREKFLKFDVEIGKRKEKMLDQGEE